MVQRKDPTTEARRHRASVGNEKWIDDSVDCSVPLSLCGSERHRCSTRKLVQVLGLRRREKAGVSKVA